MMLNFANKPKLVRYFSRYMLDSFSYPLDMYKLSSHSLASLLIESMLKQTLIFVRYLKAILWQILAKYPITKIKRAKDPPEKFQEKYQLN